MFASILWFKITLLQKKKKYFSFPALHHLSSSPASYVDCRITAFLLVFAFFPLSLFLLPPSLLLLLFIGFSSYLDPSLVEPISRSQYTVQSWDCPLKQHTLCVASETVSFMDMDGKTVAHTQGVLHAK